ncbi:MAG: 3-oxoacyl-ACP reductase FabG [Oscillospiraceae bacterium]|nr:3-oxoacyl-ACP reductase FabG [Oscillospiraceae bacterium]MBQ9982775.1 3-oxoacyl-ACP reductase FabG [Oscillospiraceae bacterium]
MWLAKTVLITGASRGIGAATAEIFADNGYNVIINYNKNHERAKQIASKTGGNLIQADVSDIAQTEKMIDSIISEYGKIDVLVNNAGISVTGTFDSISDEDARRLFDVNIFGTFNCTKLVLPHMLRRKYGKIINVSSMWGQVGASCEVHYSASKAAVIGFTKALAKEVGPSGITVNCVSPGFISTDMTACYTKEEVNAICEEIPVGRTGSPYEVAQAVFYLASEQATYITGQVLGINGGMIV